MIASLNSAARKTKKARVGVNVAEEDPKFSVSVPDSQAPFPFPPLPITKKNQKKKCVRVALVVEKPYASTEIDCWYDRLTVVKVENSKTYPSGP